jgi:hypothetical protein
MTPKPLFSPFEITLLIILFLVLALWVYACIRGNILARKEQELDRQIHLINTPGSLMSNLGNITYKN